MGKALAAASSTPVQEHSEEYMRGYQDAMEEAKLHLFNLMVDRLQPMDETDYKFFKRGENGDEILCDEPEPLEVIADLLDAMGYDSVTGSYDAKEDVEHGQTDELTGLYYCDIS